MDQSYDVDALFDTAAEGKIDLPTARADDTVTPALKDHDLSNNDVFQRVGALTRTLHDALRELGYEHHIQNAVGSLPDARARLSYIADLTGNAADKVLSAVDDGMAAEERMHKRAKDMAAKLGTIQQPSLRADAHEFALAVQAHSEHNRARLTDIMMAQDFHDLTGQVIKKVADVAQNLEQQLVKLLLDMTPPDQRGETPAQLLEGPVVDKSRTDVVHDQGQVDDLLDSLGF